MKVSKGRSLFQSIQNEKVSCGGTHVPKKAFRRRHSEEGIPKKAQLAGFRFFLVTSLPSYPAIITPRFSGL